MARWRSYTAARIEPAASTREGARMTASRMEPSAPRPARFAYVGAYTREAPGGGGAVAEGISVFAVAAGSGELSLVQTVSSDNPSFLAFDPAQRFLYAVNEVAGDQGYR